MTFFSKSRRHLLAAAGVASVLSLAACGGGGSDSGDAATWATVSGSTAITTLQTTDTTVGTGATAGASSTVSVTYTGWLYDVRVTGTQKGTQFDSNVGATTPLSFQIGKGQVISGFEQGVTGMKVGGKRTIVIPASLAYGANGLNTIPGGAALIFEVQLLSAQ
ncbi:FKBP-type peptidyl-prolyl cis-trans isomerase [Paucibacter sp. R3-3]|uniref:Peptidyl-prolyl cis-trans isomerase n=1 Tax=Roseateles agri TaxID=3098619 RepID=A0ABU5DEJ8_9BURK|nr:FKBP-type peptidyl-prolyl cis-trans isomerase [Paucibacter sp. R3-3]MDY0744700.1 FKBP-type peptidyl-prolyl cis-trans isomerase [Paucibacter sp. R3-3]